MSPGTPRKYFQILKNQKYGFKTPPICDMGPVKVYRNPWVRAESAETFTIDVVLHDAQNGLCPPPPQFLWGREIGVFVKNDRYFRNTPISRPQRN